MKIPSILMLFSSYTLFHVVSGELYCPGNAKDMNDESSENNVAFVKDGWTITGDGRVSSKTAFNLLGGYIEFDMDVTRVAPEVNTNFYTTSPTVPNCGVECYCDIQRSSSGKPSCMELDILENNGRCLLATTLHTFATDGQPNNRNCDRWGCQTQMRLPQNGTFHVRSEFSKDGDVTVLIDGIPNHNYSPYPSSASQEVVVSTMKSIGAVIESSQWYGWVPGQDQCPTGDSSGLVNSFVAVSNVVVSGTVVQGPTPTTCDSPQPTPTPTPTPTPDQCPSQSPERCDCGWTSGGSKCPKTGGDDGSECFCRCCCEYTSSKTCKWQPSFRSSMW